MKYQVLCGYLFSFMICLFIFNSNLIYCQYRLGKQIDSGLIVTQSSYKGYLYSGIDNFLKIDPSLKKDYDTIILKSNNGKIYTDSNNLILIIPDRPGKVRLTLTGITNKDTTELGYFYFIVFGIPEPKLTLNTIPIESPCSIPKKALVDCDSLGVYFSNDIIGSENWVKVSRFTLGYNYGGFYISHLNPSNKFTLNTKQILNQLGPDREITIRPTIETEGKVSRELPIYKITIY
jgi:hypothetical protein